MSLVDSRQQRTFTLCALYMAQGVPWGFMLLTLPAYLAYKHGYTVDEIGRLKAIILVPWSFKLIWAPIMDSFTLRSMGRRRSWIIGSELMMAVTLLGFIGMGDLSEQLKPILYMYFLHNCFASLQDVCTDALAVDILPYSEYGSTNGLMWGSKLVGKGVGAWALTHVLHWGGIEACVAVQIALLLAVMLVPLFILERPGEKRFPWSKGQAGTTATNSVRNPLKVILEFLKAFSLTTTLVFAVFALAMLVGSGINETLINTLCTQELSPRWTDELFTRVTGLYATVPTILAALVGGILADRFGRRGVIIAGFCGLGLVAIIFASYPGLWNERWFVMSYIISFEVFHAIASVGFLSMAMRISWTTAAATVFTTYMTISNLSHVFGNELAGRVRRMFVFAENGESATLVSYEGAFYFIGAVTIVPVLLMILVRPEQVDRARETETSPSTDA